MGAIDMGSAGLKAQCFDSAQAMSDHQAERELQEALRVQGMTPEARWLWLQETWGRLQNSAAFLSPIAQPVPGAARCYASLDEKNRFDEDRELRQALQLPIHAARQP
jgi:hypothetical protein